MVRPAARFGVVAALALAAAGASGCRGDADFSDAMPAPVTLKAEDYRREILAIDRLVFAPGPFDPGRRSSLAKELEDLASRVKGVSDSRFLAIEALELRRLGSIAKGMPANAPRTALENNWMRIRSNLFDDRSWFARRAADLDPGPGP